LLSYKDYKQHVAPLYKSEIDRRLFATASGDRGKKLKDQMAILAQLRDRLLGRSTPEETESEEPAT
jgi:hypothetical protein